MKKLYIIPIFIIILSLNYACDDLNNFLDKAPGVDVTEDTIFSSKEQVELFVSGTYYYGVTSDVYGWWDDRDRTSMNPGDRCDEAEVFAPWFPSQSVWNSAAMSPTNGASDLAFATYWIALRRANILIEKIMDAPFDNPAYKTQVFAEAKFIRAFVTFTIFKKYGGAPLLKKRLNPEDQLKIPRSTVKETVDFIVQDCDSAIAKLPQTYPTAMRGRITKAAALALKSRTLLYAASKTFNTATPYIDFGEHNDLICYGNEDKERWNLAAQAAKAVLDECPAAGFRLITEYGADSSYRYVWETPDNSEIILAEKSHPERWQGHFPFNYFFPGQGLFITWNFMKEYETKNGEAQPWNQEGGENLMAIYKNMDPRFKQTVSYHGQFFNVDYPMLDLTMTGAQRPIGNGCHSAYVHKTLPYSVNNSTNTPGMPNAIIFRVAEFYLNYAEALNEYNSTPPDAAYDAVDVVRARSGMPALPRGLTQSVFREKVRNERAIELAYEGHRIFDILRWEIADDGIMKGKMYGIKQYKITGSTEIRYEPYVFEVRSFKTAMYRHPFPQNEINKGYLIQNPGY